MIDRNLARRIVAEHIQEGCTTEDGVTPVILDDETIEREALWVFFYESREYLDTGDFSRQLVGNAPLIVDRADGSVHETGTSRPVERYIERHERRIYADPPPITRGAAQRAFASTDAREICGALVSATFSDPDWRWVEWKCLEFCRHANPEIRGLAATCLGHLARIHGQLSLDKVKPCLQDLRSDPEVAGRAEDALDDIEMYLRRQS